MKAILRTATIIASLVATSATGAPGVFEDLAVVSGGVAHPYRVEVMRTPAERARGMMFREVMPPGTAMLFEMPSDERASFWMKDTPLSLDMVFVRRDGTVDSISRRAVPYSTAVVSSSGPVAGVLEIPGGEADRIGLRAGDVIRHPLFAPDAKP